MGDTVPANGAHNHREQGHGATPDVDSIELVSPVNSSIPGSRNLNHSSRRKQTSQSSRWNPNLTRPLSFNGSIWLKEPEDIVPQFDVVENEAQQPSSDPPHHVFSRCRKKRLVYLVSVAGMLSPLSSNIYFPATVAISEALHTSVELIGFTITIYMLFQGLAPSFWGPLADTYGRRPTLIATMLVYIVANLGLAFTPSFAVLMVFRGIQAIGSSSTIAIGAGVIGDVAIAAERGGFMGLFGGLRMFGQAFGPVIGGTLAQYLGFRSIFWFLFIIAILVTFLLILLLPETLRAIAGSGDRKLYGVYRPLLNPPRGPDIAKEDRYKCKRVSFSSLFESLQMLRELDVLVTLIFGGITYTVWSMMTSSTASLFEDEYELSNVLIGLCFLPNGIGCVLGSLITGKLLDRDYKKEASKYRAEHGVSEETELEQEEFPDFPIERARLRSVFVLNAVFVVSIALYGMSVEWHIAIPLILQFFGKLSLHVF
jgi:multidrug resistance protein